MKGSEEASNGEKWNSVVLLGGCGGVCFAQKDKYAVLSFCGIASLLQR